MAVTRITNSGFTSAFTKYDDMLAGYPPLMAAPTAADGGTGTSATVSFTAVSGATGYRAISNPGSFTGTGSSSPVTVSGLTAGTAYTFQIQAQNSVGYGAYSAASNSVTPVTPSSFESIATATANGSSGTITFSSIPSTYTHLQVRFNARITGAGANRYAYFLQWSGSSTYPYHYLLGNGSAASASGATGNSEVYIDEGMPAETATASCYGVNIIDIHDYASTTKNKTVRLLGGYDTNSSNGKVYMYSGMRLSTTAISSLTIATNATWVSGSTFALYGIKGA